MSTTATQAYVPGYSSTRKKFQGGRRADLHACFVLSLIKKDSRILDCGCGTGSITNDFAALASKGEVVGIDMAESQIKAAREAAQEMSLTNTHYFQQNLFDLHQSPNFKENQFDIVYAHAVLEHLSDPTSAVQQLVRVLKPGGVIALCDAEWPQISYSPFSAAAQEIMNLYQDRIRANGGDPDVTKHFGSLLNRLGFTDVRLSAYQEVHQNVAPLAKAVCEAVIKQSNNEQTKRRCEAFRAWAEKPTSKMVEVWTAAVGIKPYPA